MKTLPNRTRYGQPVRVGNTARVTFSTKRRTAAPQIIRARIELFGLFDCTGADATEPRIVAQAEDGSWITWESTYTPRCQHPSPVEFGASEVTWTGATGYVLADCEQCGEMIRWEVTEE